jgi:hypothetical protein
MGPWISQQGVSILLAGKAVRPRYLPELAQWLSEQNQRLITVEDLVPSKFARKKRPAYLAEVPTPTSSGESSKSRLTRSRQKKSQSGLSPPANSPNPLATASQQNSSAATSVGPNIAWPTNTRSCSKVAVLTRSSQRARVVWCIPVAEVMGGLATDQYVHVVRISEENHMEEHSIRLLKMRPGRIELHPDSFDESKQTYCSTQRRTCSSA